MDETEFQKLLRKEENRSGNSGIIIALILAALSGFVVGVLVGKFE